MKHEAASSLVLRRRRGRAERVGAADGVPDVRDAAAECAPDHCDPNRAPVDGRPRAAADVRRRRGIQASMVYDDVSSTSVERRPREFLSSTFGRNRP